MDASELCNSSDTRLAVTRVITWTTDPNSPDVRKVTRCDYDNLIQLQAAHHGLEVSADQANATCCYNQWRKTRDIYSIINFTNLSGEFKNQGSTTLVVLLVFITWTLWPR